MHDLDAVEQIASKSARGHELFEVAVGGRDDPHVDADRPARATHRLNLAALEEPEKVRLHLQAHFGDLVEEDRPAMRRLEAAHAVAIGASEAAARVAEELGFEETVGDRRAVDSDEGPRGTRRVGVDVLRDDIFPDAALAGDEDLGIAGRRSVASARTCRIARLASTSRAAAVERSVVVWRKAWGAVMRDTGTPGSSTESKRPPHGAAGPRQYHGLALF